MLGLVLAEHELMTDIWFATLISWGTTMTTVLPTGISLAIVLLIVNYVSV
jgi:hypothetical protein